MLSFYLSVSEYMFQRQKCSQSICLLKKVLFGINLFVVYQYLQAFLKLLKYFTTKQQSRSFLLESFNPRTKFMFNLSSEFSTFPSNMVPCMECTVVVIAWIRTQVEILVKRAKMSNRETKIYFPRFDLVLKVQTNYITQFVAQSHIQTSFYSLFQHTFHKRYPTPL